MNFFRYKLIFFLRSIFLRKSRKNYSFSISDIDTKEYLTDYALKKQYLLRIRNGYPYDFYDKTVLEIGCGHGGISVFLAVNGAKNVVGIDINKKHLEAAIDFKKQIEKRLGLNAELSVKFYEMDAYNLILEHNYFDIVIADNVFEHFENTQKVFVEAFGVLKPGGQLIVPSFNAVRSRYGAHLKYGLGIPWVNVFFSESTICGALSKLAESEPDLYSAYKGLKYNPKTLRELREYNDLNGMKHSRFIKEAENAGFVLLNFRIIPPFKYFNSLFNFLYKFIYIRDSWVSDIFSKGASAILQKPQR